MGNTRSRQVNTCKALCVHMWQKIFVALQIFMKLRDYREYLDTILSKIIYFNLIKYEVIISKMIQRTLASVASLNGVLKTIFPFGYYFASVLKCDKLRDNHGKKQCSNCIIKALHHRFALRNPQ